MSLVSNNIKSLRKKHQYTQEQFARRLGIKRSLLGAYEEARAKPRLDILVKAANLFNVSVDQLVAADFQEQETTAVSGNSGAYVPDQPQPARLISKQQQARYFGSRDDQQFLGGLPEIRLPMISDSTHIYRAFEITDDAMLPVMPGTVVVGRKEENLPLIRDAQAYVVVSRDGIWLRTVYNRISEDGTLLLQAANPSYPKTTLSLLGKEVEVWEVMYYISRQVSFAPAQAAPASMDLQQLTRMVMHLQQEVQQLKKS